MSKKVLSVLALLAMAAVLPAMAGTVVGTVTDTADNPLAGVIVTVSSFTGGTTVIDTTNASGLYSCANVSQGFHPVTATKSGYTTVQDFVQVRSGTSTDTADLVMTPLGAGGKVIGTVTDSAAGTPLSGAKVYLQEGGTGGQPTVVDSATTGADGKYTLDSIQQGNFSVRATATGYAARTSNVTADGSTTDTLNFRLRAIVYGKVIGTVTEDSLKGPALAGVEVILAQRAGGGRLTPIDTLLTGADGKYAFTTVQAGNYTLDFSKTGYVADAANATVTGTGTDTVNIFLAAEPRGSLYVIASKASDSTVIAGASVTATVGFGGTPLIGTTNASGIVAFVNIATGTYSVSASMVGYTTRTRNNVALADGARDTVKLYLVASTAATKTLIGTVTDSTTGNALAGVQVVFRTQGGTAVTLFDSTDATGKYSIAGIPMTANFGTMTATKAGYINFTGIAQLQDTVDTLDFTMRANPVQVVMSLSSASTLSPMITAAVHGLVVSGIATPAVLKLYTLNGVLVYRASVKAGTTAVALPNNAGRTLVAIVKQQGSEFRSTITIK